MLAQLVQYLALGTPSPRDEHSHSDEKNRLSDSKDTTTRSQISGLRTVEMQRLSAPPGMNEDARARGQRNSAPSGPIGLGLFNHSPLLPSSPFSSSSDSGARRTKSSKTAVRSSLFSIQGRPGQYPRASEEPPHLSDKENSGLSNAKGIGRPRRTTTLGRPDDPTTRPLVKDRHVHIISPEKPPRKSYTSSHGADKVELRNPPALHLSRSPLSSDTSSLRPSVLSSNENDTISLRKSWFNIFTFKPASFSLLSVCDGSATRKECVRLLEALSVEIELLNTDLSAGVLKCSLDDILDPTGVKNCIKGVRFRVEFRVTTHPSHLSSGYITSVILTQEKGALSTFKLIYNALRRDWDMDAPRTPGGASMKIVPSPIF
ncbi:hypothetical protein BS47DRAFT_424308 [Hydnum rufescens UP504]|uniref:Non-specific serine/threonine protein kinase n=1 Tax=Hydnum rufescens UP504 TaxID=1448309 RepID=A0A9P6B5W3_9AGAM|nr:hypothetical protein BS47DRAFT_424308 [Hydnum rufescens UP504]